jgi:hypothetical protein
MLDTWGWHGHIEIIVRDEASKRRRIITHARFENLIVNTGKNYIRDVLRGVYPTKGITYVALGSSSTAVNAADTQLGSEQTRKALTVAQTASSTGQVISTVYFAPGEANSFTIAEIGWFAGSTATGTANSGVLIAHVLYSLSKTSTQSLQINRTDQF